MAVVRLFQTLRDKVKNDGGLLPMEGRAMFWFKEYATALTRWQSRFANRRLNTLAYRDDFTKQVVAPNMPQPGFLYFFQYNAKTQNTLPYWDAFPFSLCIHRYKDSWLGINFHYLSYGDRARFFDALYRFREGRNPSKNEDRSEVRDIRMRLKVTYGILKVTQQFAAYKPCIKRYLYKYTRSGYLLKVGAREWDVALMLPVAQFQKCDEAYVWRQSRKKFR